MKNLLYFLLLICVPNFSSAQEYNHYQGIVVINNVPISKARICIERANLNSPYCVNSDKEGKYKIDVAEGEIIKITIGNSSNSFIYKKDPFDGKEYLTEVEYVSNKGDWSLNVEDSSKFSKNYPLKEKPNLNQYGYYDYFGDFAYHNPYTKIKIKNDSAQLLSDLDHIKAKMGIDLGISYMLTEHGELPKLQDNFIQGMPVNGALAPTNFPIPYSWGPDISGFPNYSKFDPNDIFQKGNIFKSDLNIIYSNNQNLWNFNFSGKNESGILDPIKNDFYSFKLNNRSSLFYGILKSNLYVTLQDEKMPMVGNNYSNILFGAWNSPFHFDRNPIVVNGNQNTASTYYNNPDFLLNYNKDRNRENTISGGFDFSRNWNRWTINALISYSYFGQRLEYGQIPSMVSVANPQFYSRKVDEHLTNFNLNAKYKHNRLGFDFYINQQLRMIALDKQMFTNYSSLENFPNNGLNVQMYDHNFQNSSTLVNAAVSYDILDDRAFITNKFTQGILLTNLYKNSALYQFENLLSVDFNRNSYRNLNFKLDAKLELLYNEPNLLNHNLNFNSLNQSLNNFTTYREPNELFVDNKFEKLEKKFNSEAALTLSLSRIFDLTFLVYHYKINDAFAPVFTDNAYQWKNVADYHQTGLEISLSNGYHFKQHDFKWDFLINFHTYQNKTDRILLDQDRVAFFGFQEVSKNFIKDQPVGVIVGNDFQRDVSGNIIIGDDGFPIVDQNLKIIADPNPDFNLSFFNEFKFKNLSLSFTFDWQKGGQIWNGTQNTLNYFGRSELSGDQRNITGFIFQGVNSDGQSNTIPVDFANPSNELETNRWVRYEQNGVAAEAIQDASFFRMQNIKLTYKSELKKFHHSLISQFSVSLFAQNLWIISDYDGVFSGNGLLGNATGTGMDYFNFPLTKMYGISFNIKF